MNNETKIWTRGDLIAGLATGLIAFAVYAWTVAPNVTLLDSGEFTVAAQHFGVPHPTGYPLWTLLAWIFTLLPIGNAAYEINLFSSVCAGLAVGLFTALTRSTLRWLMGDSLAKWPGLSSAVTVTCGLLFAFSFSMWSQATITEVYALHALVIGAYLAALYAWLRRPDCLGILMLSFFLLALSFSNHQLTLSMPALSLLAVLLVRRQIFWDLLLASLITALLAYLAFAILSSEANDPSAPLLLKTALRFAFFVFSGFFVLLAVRHVKRMGIEWRLIAYLPFVVALGLLPYAYMPIASSTNPPMNWAYTSSPAGFFFSFNRSQYDSPLSEVSLRTLGRVLGSVPASATKPPKNADAAQEQPKPLSTRIQEWAGFFWLQLTRSFTLLGILGYFGAMFVLLRLCDVERRTWVYVLEIGFVLAVFLQPILEGATIDASGWWQQMPYHTYTNFFFALLAAIGIAFGATRLFERIPRLAALRFALLLLPLVPFTVNYDGCSQKDRWFGWQFGHDMLKDLPKGSIVLGGTDPGRFVPTYMIFGESGQPAKLKRDPAFDRRDLYIITQNGVGEPLYRNYLADHYGPNRPTAARASKQRASKLKAYKNLPKINWLSSTSIFKGCIDRATIKWALWLDRTKSSFERRLGRNETYPQETLVFPTDAEIKAAMEKELHPAPGSPTKVIDRTFPHSEVTRLIWEKNRDKHAFFVEESFPLKWSYDYALPHGLVYQITKEPLKEIPADVVQKDFAFWNKYIQDLLSNPDFSKDYDAQRSFSKLRTTTGNLYLHRKMDKEAKLAHLQALALWQANPESLQALVRMLWDQSEYVEARAIIEPAMDADPNNEQLLRLWAVNEKFNEAKGEILSLQATLARQPRSRDTTQNLLKLYSTVGDTNKASALLDKSITLFQDDPDFLRIASLYAEGNKLEKQQMAAASRLASIEPGNPENFIALARAAFSSNDKKAFYSAVKEAIRTGGEPMREAVDKVQTFAPWHDDAEFKEIVNRKEESPIPPEPQKPAAPADKK